MCERDRLAEVGLGQFGLAYFEPQFSATGQSIGPEDEFLGVRLERLLDGDESVVDLAVEGLGLGQTREVIRDIRPVPASARPAKPWRISATPSPALPSCARAQPSNVAGQIPDERKAVLFSDG